jgi:hypothetical protein
MFYFFLSQLDTYCTNRINHQTPTPLQNPHLCRELRRCRRRRVTHHLNETSGKCFPNDQFKSIVFFLGIVDT